MAAAQRVRWLIAAALVIGAPADAFSVNGRRGPFLKSQVKPAELEKNDAAMSSEARGLLGKSIDRGELEGVALHMRSTEQRLEKMLERVRTAWVGGAGKDWQFRDPGHIRIRIVASSDYGAKVKPDNVMLIPYGLLDPTLGQSCGPRFNDTPLAKTDDEIYWVLAHEFAHIGLAHFAADLNTAQTRDGLNKTVSGVLAIGELAQQKIVKNGNQLQMVDRNDPAARKVADQAWAYADRAREGISLVFNALSINREDEADVAAVDLARAMALDRGSFKQALCRLNAVDGSHMERAKAMKQAFKTLLWPDQSFMAMLGQALETVINNGGKLDVQAMGSLAGKSILRNLAPVAMDVARAQLSRSHRDADDRLNGLRDYMSRAKISDNWPAAKPGDTMLKEIWADPEFVAAGKMMAALNAAREELAKGNYEAAETAMLPATRSIFAGSPAVANMMARIKAGRDDLVAAEGFYDQASGLIPDNDRRPDASRGSPTSLKQGATMLAQGAKAVVAQNNAAPARAQAGSKTRKAASTKQGKVTKPIAKTAAALPPPKASTDPYYGQGHDGFQEHVNLLIRAGRFRRGLLVIEEAKRRFGDDAAFLPQLFQLHYLRGDSTAATAAVVRCADQTDVRIKDQCFSKYSQTQNGQSFDVMAAADKDKMGTAISKMADGIRLQAKTPPPQDDDDDEENERPARQPRP